MLQLSSTLRPQFHKDRLHFIGSSPTKQVLWLKKSTCSNSSSPGSPSSHRGPLCPTPAASVSSVALDLSALVSHLQRCWLRGAEESTPGGRGSWFWRLFSSPSLASTCSILPLPSCEITAVSIPCQMSHEGKPAPN